MENKNQSEKKLAIRLSGYAASAGAIALISSSAGGQVVHSGLQDIELNMMQYQEIDLDKNMVMDFGFILSGNSYLNTYASYYMRRRFGYGVIINPKTDLYDNSWMIHQDTIRTISTLSGYTYKMIYPVVHGLAVGDDIGPDADSWSSLTFPMWPGALGVGSIRSSYGPYSSYYYRWGAGDFLDQTRIVGVRFYIGSDQHYGWIRLSVGKYLEPMRILDWAYRTTPGQSIAAGEGGDIDGPSVVFSGFETWTVNPNVTLIVTMDEDGEGLEPDGIQVSNGSVTSLHTVTTNRVYLLKVQANNYGVVSVQIPEGTVKDIFGNSNNLSETSWEYVAVSLDKDRQEKVPFTVFPNPAESELVVETELASDLQLVDIKGRVLYEKKHIHRYIIDVSAYDPGIYILHLTNKEGNHQKQVVIR